MPSITEIPDSFWALFRSWNRQLYMEALLALNEEYQYNNYFISWDACLQVLDSFFAERQLFLYEEDSEPDGVILYILQTPPLANLSISA